MKRSRAFVLVELLTTLLLQAGFILVMCASFYLLASFYSKSQQLLTARDHAERVILFFEDKMIHAGLGLWKLATPTNQTQTNIRNALGTLTDTTNKMLQNRTLPISLTANNDKNTRTSQKTSGNRIHYGSCVTLLYAERDLSSSSILVTQSPVSLASPGHTLTLLGSASDFFSEHTNTALSNWAVTEGVGVPFSIDPDNFSAQGQGTIASSQTIPEGDELLHLRCIQMFVQGKTTDEGGRQFAFSELRSDATDVIGKYNQEEGVLEIYMELDTQTNIFTLWVMGTGGFDLTIDTPRPANWPNRAAPLLNNNTNQNTTQAKQAWNNAGYNHHIVYVSRASWKLNNIPDGFNWN